MTVHVVIREDQNEHGFVDSGVVGLFRMRADADAFLQSSAADTREEGLRVSGDPHVGADWDVAWKVEQHTLL